ncbi:MAG: hypothetical protein NXH85_07665 [Pseudomonadaceae bacterium]|nr:hypothetical protein [Pseudomonadaceae bacterium]
MWKEAEHIFSNHDGSLPEVAFPVSNTALIAPAYECLRNSASRFESRLPPSYWSKSLSAEVEIRFNDNPAVEIATGDAEPFHVLFGGIRSRGEYCVPPLGVFCCSEEIAVDYRMGPDWNEQSVLGLFELLDELAQVLSTDVFEHRENENDGGTDLLSIWQIWRNSVAA